MNFSRAFIWYAMLLLGTLPILFRRGDSNHVNCSPGTTHIKVK